MKYLAETERVVLAVASDSLRTLEWVEAVSIGKPVQFFFIIRKSSKVSAVRIENVPESCSHKISFSDAST